MSKPIGITTMTGDAIYVGDRWHQNTVKKIVILDVDVVKIEFDTTLNIVYIPFHNIATWLVEVDNA
jgi:hypothetical protein